jgi:rod shape-determining protein MreC
MRDRNLFSSTITRPAGAMMWIGASLVILLSNFIFPTVTASVRTTVVDILSPLVNVAGKPAEMAQGLQGQLENAAHLRAENEALREEVANLKTWAEAARQFEEENRRLKEFLRYKDAAVISYITTRVISESGGGFRNSVLVTAGSHAGVEKDMIALDENGVVGRVIEVGNWSSRVLLYNDLNFRLPVTVEEANQRAIFAGQGRQAPKLMFVPQELEVKPGMRVITSGHGGIFPAGLQVGVVQESSEGTITVRPYGRIDTMELIRLVRYGMPKEPEPVSEKEKTPADELLQKADPVKTETPKTETPALKTEPAAPKEKEKEKDVPKEKEKDKDKDKEKAKEKEKEKGKEKEKVEPSLPKTEPAPKTEPPAKKEP